MVDAAFYLKDLGGGILLLRRQVLPCLLGAIHVFGPAPIKDHWKSLAQAGFDTVDAVFPVQGIADDI
jgi:hypothetical protein